MVVAHGLEELNTGGLICGNGMVCLVNSLNDSRTKRYR